MKEKKILILVSGSIAVLKISSLIKSFKDEGFVLRCIFSKNAIKLTKKSDLKEIENICNFPCYPDCFDEVFEKEIGHISLSRWADLILLCPASANKISAMTFGLGRDFIETILLASTCPVIIAPALNPIMYEAIKDNLKSLKKQGYNIIYPEFGKVLCGDIGYGRLANLKNIMSFVKDFYQKKPFLGYNVFVNTGGCIEDIDNVRYICNKSSGEQGIQIANAFCKLGAKVSLFYANINYPLPKNKNIRKIKSLSSKDMLDNIYHMLNCIGADIFVGVAAVSDFIFPTISQKIEKQYDEDGNSMGITLNLEPNIDIVKMISKANNKPSFIACFSAQDDNDTQKAFEKMQRKSADMIFLNNIKKDVFGKKYNHILKIDKNKKIEDFGHKSKRELAFDICKSISLEVLK